MRPYDNVFKWTFFDIAVKWFVPVLSCIQTVPWLELNSLDSVFTVLMYAKAALIKFHHTDWMGLLWQECSLKLLLQKQQIWLCSVVSIQENMETYRSDNYSVFIISMECYKVPSMERLLKRSCEFGCQQSTVLSLLFVSSCWQDAVQTVNVVGGQAGMQDSHGGISGWGKKGFVTSQSSVLMTSLLSELGLNIIPRWDNLIVEGFILKWFWSYAES